MKRYRQALAGIAFLFLSLPLSAGTLAVEGSDSLHLETLWVGQAEEMTEAVPSVTDHADPLAVTEEAYARNHRITGRITAEGLGEAGDYAPSGVSGGQGRLQAVVEAVYGDRTAVGLVYSDGTYEIELPEGKVQLRARVPGHLEASVEIEVNGDRVIDFDALIAGDVNGDQNIDLQDLQIVARRIGKETEGADELAGIADLNRDGNVDRLDLSYILKNFGKRKE